VGRVACLLVPDLPLAAELRAQPEWAGHPLAIADSTGGRATLLSISPEAAALGIRRGHTVTQARTLCGDLCVRICSPALEASARDSLLDIALAFSPRARLAPLRSGAWAAEASVWIDASGIETLFRSEAGFATALLERARKLGLPGCVTLAASQTLAQLAARRLSTTGRLEVQIVPPGEEAAFLAPLPVDLLDPDDDLAQALTRFGVSTLRELQQLPRRALSSRLGARILPLLELAEGRGREPPLPVPKDACIAEAQDLEHPVDRLEPLLFVIQGLLSRLLDRLEVRHLACSDLRLELQLAGGGRDVRQVGVAAPTHDLRVLLRLAHHALEARTPGAPVEGLRLETEGQAVHTDQMDLFRPAGPTPTGLGAVLAELTSICGEAQVGAPEVADDHHPDAFALAPFAPPKRLRQEAHDASTRAPELPALALRLLRPPVPAQVRMSGSQPCSIRSALSNGDVVRCAGPWRTTGGWWSQEGRFAFDHFDVQTSDGTVARLRFDHRRRCWQIDALYD
jgi:protein ImuB